MGGSGSILKILVRELDLSLGGEWWWWWLLVTVEASLSMLATLAVLCLWSLLAEEKSEVWRKLSW